MVSNGGLFPWSRDCHNAYKNGRLVRHLLNTRLSPFLNRKSAKYTPSERRYSLSGAPGPKPTGGSRTSYSTRITNGIKDPRRVYFGDIYTWAGKSMAMSACRTTRDFINLIGLRLSPHKDRWQAEKAHLLGAELTSNYDIVRIPISKQRKSNFNEQITSVSRYYGYHWNGR